VAVQISLSDDEQDALVRVLTNVVSDLRFEISNTERMELRQQLHKDEDLIKAVLARLA
jgi:hypothetical protein